MSLYYLVLLEAYATEVVVEEMDAWVVEVWVWGDNNWTIGNLVLPGWSDVAI